MFSWLFRKLGIPKPTGQGMRTAALFLAAPMFGGLLAWQLYGLEPERLCKTSYDLARLDGLGYLTAFKACFALYDKGLDIKDHAIIGLLGILGFGYIMMLMRELRMQGEINGPLGWGAKFQNSDKNDEPKTPADGAAKATEAAGAVEAELREEERG